MENNVYVQIKELVERLRQQINWAEIHGGISELRLTAQAIEDEIDTLSNQEKSASNSNR